jgi:hypothetical protein
MVYTESEIQAQLEAMNARLILKRRRLGLLDDGTFDDEPYKISVLVREVLAEILRGSEKAL